MVALKWQKTEFQTHTLERDITADKGFGKSPATEKTSTEADDSSSSGSSRGAAGESALGVFSSRNARGHVKRRVSFEVDECVKDHQDVTKFHSIGKPYLSPDVAGSNIDADLKVFCVHCGKRVPPEILKVGSRFCTYCGQRHPDNLMSWANTSHKITTLSEEHVRLHDEAYWQTDAAHLGSALFAPTTDRFQLEMQRKLWNNGLYDELDWRTPFLRSCPAQAAPPTNGGQVGMQHVPWNGGGQNPRAMQHLGHRAAGAEQCRPSAWEPAYVHCAQLAL